MRSKTQRLARAGVCQSCLNREAAAIKEEFSQVIPSFPPKDCQSCGLKRVWTVSPDGIVVAVCVSCILALVWDQKMQLEGLRKIAHQLSTAEKKPPRWTWRRLAQLRERNEA